MCGKHDGSFYVGQLDTNFLFCEYLQLVVTTLSAFAFLLVTGMHS